MAKMGQRRLRRLGIVFVVGVCCVLVFCMGRNLRALGDVKLGNDWKLGEQMRLGHDRRFHVVMTASGAAQQWQSRIFYYWFIQSLFSSNLRSSRYKKQKMICDKIGRCDMGNFTRILHAGVGDNLMHEIPTFVSNPLPRSYSKRDPQALRFWV